MKPFARHSEDEAAALTGGATAGFGTRRVRGAFSLIEVLITVTLLSLIILALMRVFSDTQTAFRAIVTQSDVLEGSRNTIQLIAEDLRGMTPSRGVSNIVTGAVTTYGVPNFFVTNNSVFYSPLVQKLPGTSQLRTNLLQWFFILGQNGSRWTGTGYIVDSGSSSALYPLYRYYDEVSIHQNPHYLYSNFLNAVFFAKWTNMSHIVDGVAHLVLRAQDVNGVWMTNGYSFGQKHLGQNIWYSPPIWGEVGGSFYSNTVPAAVEIQLGVIEDRTMQRAEAIPNSTARLNFLEDQAGHVHVFRQLVRIPNVVPSAYQ